MTHPCEKAVSPDLSSLPMSNWPVDVGPFEPVYGWMQRAAGENHAHSTDSFVWSLGLNGRAWDFDEQLEIVGQLPLSDFAMLKWNTPKRVATGLEICGQTLATRWFSRRERRVCPVCINEAKSIRVWFDLTPIASCPIHNVALMKGLENDPLDWLNPELGLTRSGIRISREHGTQRNASVLDRYIVAKLDGSTDGEPSLFKMRSLDTMLGVAARLSRLLKIGQSRVWNTIQQRDLLHLAFEALWAGEDAVRELIGQSAWLQAGMERTENKNRFDDALKIVEAVPDAELASLFLDSVGSIRVMRKLTTPSRRLARFDGLDGAWNLKNASAQLGMKPLHLRKMLLKLSIEYDQCIDTGAYRLSAEEIAAVREHMSKCLSEGQVASILGCELCDVSELVNRKLLPLEFRAHGKRFFDPLAIGELASRFAKVRSSDISDETISLREFAAQAQMSLAEALARLGEGSLHLASHDDEKPLFDALQVFQLSGDDEGQETTRVRPGAQAKDALTLSKAAARLGTQLEGLDHLIKAGHLRSYTDENGRRLVGEASLQSFESRYAKAVDYADALGCRPKAALMRLRDYGISPINEADTRYPRFVSRAEVKRLLGLEIKSQTGFAELELLRDQVADLLPEESVPATVRLVSDPAVVISATSRHWSFRIEPTEVPLTYRLTAGFRSKREPARLQKVIASKIEPGSIWRGAEILPQPGGGFILVDDLVIDASPALDFSLLAERSITRARELHCMLPA